ncbi:MAG TPA: DNA-3-methyladenine glycosylase [Nitrososphaeraceae archaeon]|nr:DNA-3-methyladenine glycosylase [Nitrososphaeraceae archaeon]
MSFDNCKDDYLNIPNQRFYCRSTELVAKELLGKKLVRIIRESNNKIYRLSGLIVETEAYGFDEDAASHAYRGLTPRNRPMFGEAGHAYVYFTYGNHYCVNVSARSSEVKAGAVLIRALQPLEGVRIMKILRNTDDELALSSGPGKLTQALRIDKSLNGQDMTNARTQLHIENGINPQRIISSTRIGIREAREKKWRFILASKNENGDLVSRYVSRKKINYNS